MGWGGIGLALLIAVILLVRFIQDLNVSEEDKKIYLSYPLTNIIVITKQLSEPIVINKEGLPYVFNLVAGPIDTVTSFEAFYTGIGGKSWQDHSPAYNDMGKDFVPRLETPGAVSVRFCLSPDAKMDKAEIYYIITKR